MLKMKVQRNKKTKYRERMLSALRLLLVTVTIAGLWITFLNLGSFLKGFTLYQSYTAEQGYSEAYPGKTIEDESIEYNKNLIGAGFRLLSVKKPSRYAKRLASLSHRIGSQPVLYPIRPKKGEMFGELYIPALEASLPIYEGTEEKELEKGVGHFADSVLPGENDNSVLSGHRDTVFRGLGKVGEGDLLVVSTEAGEFTYRVNQVRIVDKDDRTVIVPKPSATLTVSTCYPFRYIGSAPERYVLSAYLESKQLSE